MTTHTGGSAAWWTDREPVGRRRRRLGSRCNTGEYSTIAASHAALVVAIDGRPCGRGFVCLAARVTG